MPHRRSSSDSKSTHNLNDLFCSMSSTHRPQSTSSLPTPSSTNRVTMYSIREKFTPTKLTRTINEQTSETDTDTKQILFDIPYNSQFLYYIYITFQNLVHIHVIYMLLYHAVFWLDPTYSQDNLQEYTESIEKTEYEETYFITLFNDYNTIVRSPINIHPINTCVYKTLIGISLFEFFTAYIWTVQKKIYMITCRHSKFRNFLCLLISGFIIAFYFAYFIWFYIHTFVTHYLTKTIFGIGLSHLIILTLLDKPYLFCNSSTDLFSVLNTTRKQCRPFVCSVSSPSSTLINSTNRFPYRPSLPIQSRKTYSIFPSFVFSSRWWPIMEQKITVHQCSLIYEETRKEADELWSVVLRRILLAGYRTLASFVIFDIIPYLMIDTDVRSVNIQQYHILIMIFTLTTFLTHTIFMFPVEFQITLHHLATHLGHWRLQSSIQRDSIHEWSTECNSYIRGNQIKYSSNHKEQYFIGEQHSSNAAHPQSISHSILYRIFHNRIYFLSKQFLLCIILILWLLLWFIQGKFWYEILISIAVIIQSSFTIFQIIRDRLIFDMIDDNEYDEINLKSKEKKSN